MSKNQKPKSPEYYPAFHITNKGEIVEGWLLKFDYQNTSLGDSIENERAFFVPSKNIETTPVMLWSHEYALTREEANSESSYRRRQYEDELSRARQLLKEAGEL